MSDLAGLGRFQAQTARDTEQWARFADLVSAHGDYAFSRDPLIGGHITGSAFILSPDRRAVLLTHHRKLNIWVQLGGHCDGIADVRFVALKEAYEESGLTRLRMLSDEIFDIDIHEIPANPKEPAHLHYDARFLMQAEAGEIVVSDESHDLKWVPLTDIQTYTREASVLRMVSSLDRFV